MKWPSYLTKLTRMDLFRSLLGPKHPDQMEPNASLGKIFPPIVHSERPQPNRKRSPSLGWNGVLQTSTACSAGGRSFRIHYGDNFRQPHIYTTFSVICASLKTKEGLVLAGRPCIDLPTGLLVVSSRKSHFWSRTFIFQIFFHIRNHMFDGNGCLSFCIKIF